MGLSYCTSPSNTILSIFLYFTKGINKEGSRAVGASSTMHILSFTFSKYFSKQSLEQLLSVETIM